LVSQLYECDARTCQIIATAKSTKQLKIDSKKTKKCKKCKEKRLHPKCGELCSTCDSDEIGNSTSESNQQEVESMDVIDFTSNSESEQQELETTELEQKHENNDSMAMAIHTVGLCCLHGFNKSKPKHHFEQDIVKNFFLGNTQVNN
jgi:hypothetical protein